jgi:YaiO family outer membrane protein
MARELGGDKARIDAALDQLPKVRPLMAVATPAAVAGTPNTVSVAERGANPETVAASGYKWGAGFGASVTDVSRLDARWNEQSMSVRRYSELGSIAFESLRAHRFGKHDSAWALDAYTRLWSGAYANLRYQHSATERLFPEYFWRAEVWQGLGSGWEASLSEDQLHFASSTVRVHGASIARYVGNFYLLLRLASIDTGTSDGSGRRLLARWYDAGDADNYVEMALSGGRSEDALSLVGGRTHSRSVSVSGVRYLARDWGFKAGFGYARATNAGNEKSLSFSISHRW